MEQNRDYEKDKSIDIAFDARVGFNSIIKKIHYDNVIPMFLKKDYDMDDKKCIIYLFDKEGGYKKYSKFNIKDI